MSYVLLYSHLVASERVMVVMLNQDCSSHTVLQHLTITSSLIWVDLVSNQGMLSHNIPSS